MRYEFSSYSSHCQDNSICMLGSASADRNRAGQQVLVALHCELSAAQHRLSSSFPLSARISPMPPIIKYAFVVYPLSVYAVALLWNVAYEEPLEPLRMLFVIGFAIMFYVPICLFLTFLFYPIYLLTKRNLVAFLLPPLVLALFQNNAMASFAGQDAPFFRLRIENLLHWIPLLITYSWAIADRMRANKLQAAQREIDS